MYCAICCTSDTVLCIELCVGVFIGYICESERCVELFIIVIVVLERLCLV